MYVIQNSIFCKESTYLVFIHEAIFYYPLPDGYDFVPEMLSRIVTKFNDIFNHYYAVRFGANGGFDLGIDFKRLSSLWRGPRYLDFILSI